MTNIESVRKQVAVTGPTGLSRRMILRNGLLVGAGVVAAGTMSVAHAGSAKADTTPTQKAATTPTQGNWAWCSKCQGLYWVHTNSINNVCPYKDDFGKHGQAKSSEYWVYYDTSGNTYYQDGWAWCGACAGLFWANGAKTAGSCPDLDGYGQHVNSGTNYTLGHSGAAPGSGQYGWSYCSQCNGIFYANGKARAGVCPLDGSVYVHNGTKSYDYVMLT
jgi:hypothetical protein